MGFGKGERCVDFRAPWEAWDARCKGLIEDIAVSEYLNVGTKSMAFFL